MQEERIKIYSTSVFLKEKMKLIVFQHQSFLCCQNCDDKGVGRFKIL